MSAELERAEERQRARYRVLKNIYDAAGDSITEGCDLATAFAGAAADMEEGHGILEYLNEKGLLSNATGGASVALSYLGILEIEQSIMRPEARTEYFEPGMVQYFYAAVGVVQNAADSAAHVEQTNESIESVLNADQQIVRARQERRWRVLKRIYDKADGNVGSDVHWRPVQAEEGLSDRDWWTVWNYLERGGFIRERYAGAVGITRYGIEQVEEMLRNPRSGREHHGSVRSIQQHFYAPIGAVQNAPHSTAHVTQYNTINSSELLPLIKELRARLETLPDSEEALEQVSDLEEEVQSPSPKKSRIKASLNFILSVARDTGVKVLAEAIAKSAGIS